MQQAEDFRAESKALFALLDSTDASRFEEPTQFKGWTINAVLQHLHFWNQMASFQLTDENRLLAHLKDLGAHAGGMRRYEADHFAGLGGRDLLAAWNEGVDETATVFAKADPKARLKWAGPDMSARSSITARLTDPTSVTVAPGFRTGAICSITAPITPTGTQSTTRSAPSTASVTLSQTRSHRPMRRAVSRVSALRA